MTMVTPAVGGSAHEPPTFSVVVPTFGRPQQLAACLRALAASSYPRHRYEVIVVDDGSPEPVEPLVGETAAGSSRLASGSFDVRVVRQDNAGPAAARNTGARHAAGDFLAFTDDDCAPHPGWLGAFGKRLATVPDHLLGGLTRNVLTGNPFATASQQLVEYLYGYYNQEAGRARLLTSNNMAVSRRLFGAMSGFDTSFRLAAGEDRDLCDRWVDSGRGATYVPDAVIDHAHALGPRGFLLQHYRYGRGAYSFRRARRRRGVGGMRLEPPSFYAGLLHHPLAQGRGARRWLHAALIAATQVVHAAGFFREALER